MAAVEGRRRRRSSHRDEEGRRILGKPDVWALAIFGFLVATAPLAFGAVDQAVQVGLLAVFALGLLVRPPGGAAWSVRTRRLLLVLLVLLVGKEFAPAAFFGEVHWRYELERNFSLTLPWVHHPEWGRALDALIAGGLALLWLWWVHTLAARRENRPWLVWILCGAAAAVAIVSFLATGTDPNNPAIFGLRYTPGWRGFGPFPNRNHTACLLAMGTIMAVGSAVWALVRRSPFTGVASLLLAGASLAGLLGTQSRGGVLALLAGLGIYAGLCLAKFRNRRSAAIITTIALVAAAVVLTSGSRVFSRFSAPDSATSNDTRRAIWSNTLEMWKDAPLFGHGVGSFASVFPMYEHLELDNQDVLHPESSWLLWLTELGLVPLLLLLVAAALALWPTARAALHSRRSFFLYAAGLAGVGALLCHSLIDVPGHRWGTMIFALAMLGLASSRSARSAKAEAVPPAEPRRFTWGDPGRRAAALPLAAALFWAMPLFTGSPVWSPVSIIKRISHIQPTWEERAAELQPVSAAFPLNPDLHQALGIALLRSGQAETLWRPHMDLAARLSPNSWAVPIEQARACTRRYPALAFHYWQVAIERGGFRAGEIFGNARQETATLPRSEEIWASYADAHPQYALEYIASASEELARPFYERWRQDRLLQRGVELTARELTMYYAVAPRFSSPERFNLFMRTRPEIAARDYKECARVLHALKDDEHAWQLLATKIHNPPWPEPPNATGRKELERRIAANRNNAVAAQLLGSLLMAEHEEQAAREVVYNVARSAKPPAFFLIKAGYFLQAEGQLENATEMLLRVP